MKIINTLFAILFLSSTIYAQIINTVAGNGIQGYSGDGGQATSAELFTPFGVAVGSSGDWYIADGNNNRIRKVNAVTGIITTIAGNGSQGYSGDGGQATSAELSLPYSITIDQNDNLYIADVNNNRIRKVNISTGIITTVAGNGSQGYSGDGGQATSSELNLPSGVAVDLSGNIYIADTYNNRIRRVNASTGIINTIAGDSIQGYSGDGGLAISAELYQPAGVTVDQGGNIYIADSYNNRIRKVAVGTGIINTVAGNGTTGYGGDGGVATLAWLNNPQSVILDSTGNIYIADFDNNAIREVFNGSNIINTIAGTGIAGYSGDGGPADSADLAAPSGVALDNTGNIYIADYANNRIRKVTMTCTHASYSESITICPGDTFHENSHTYTTAGTYIDTLIGGAQLGCDSIITLNLFILDSTTAYFYLQPSGTPHFWYIILSNVSNNITYSWNWGDGTSSTGDTASHTYASVGYYTICLTVTDSAGCSATYCDSNFYLYKNQSGQMVYVEVLSQFPAGITTITTESLKINYYANAVHFSEALAAPAQLRLYDMSGRVVMEQDDFSGSAWSIRSDIAQGIYIVQLQNANYSLTKKLMILQ